MEERFKRLEVAAEKAVQKLIVIERDTSLIESEQANLSKHFATKADLSEARLPIIFWLVGAIILAQRVPVLPAVLRAFNLVK